MKKGAAAMASCSAEDTSLAQEDEILQEIAVENAVVERPLRSQNLLLLNDSASAVGDLPFHFLQIHSLMGFSTDLLISYVNAAPAPIQGILHRGFRAMDVHFLAAMAAMSSKPPTPTASLCISSDVDTVEEYHSSRNPGLCTMRLGTRRGSRAHVQIQGAVQNLTGVHPEEAIARVANYDVPTVMHPVDNFCAFIDDIVNLLEDKPFVRYVRWKRAFMRAGDEYSSSGSLMRWTRVKAEENNTLVFKTIWELCTPEQYDMAMEQDPSICRPFSHIMGDTRSGSQVLYPDRKWDSWEGLQSTEEGRQRIRRLTEALSDRFEPLIAQAEAMQRSAANPPAGSHAGATLQECSEP
eukprot:CAMPEP_0177700848 /NCGR_PEP_ID=MMETSP0484_2-20121128/6307_1 /TAXON_ID=354590 /ORGANISM="Rhodomonas lens, Strain RHODO" /LENGTH=351 /DNA_ID=CAMNT_0019212063 /DNA_START=271 /DNA_END=1323 /DNA_ORIENTATION=-